MVNFPKDVGSIDDVVRHLKPIKSRAKRLIKRHTKRPLSEQEITEVGNAIYLTTFSKALRLKYTHADAKGKKGVLEPMDPLVAEVKSYGLKEIHGEFCVARLGQPAFQFGNRLLFESRSYEPKKPDSGPAFLWVKLNSFDPVQVFMQYAAGFVEDKHYGKTYVVANLKKALGVKGE